MNANSARQSLAALARQPWRLAAALLLAFLFATSVYRAATQSIAHDEGLIFEWFLAGPWSQLFGFEHGNHHPLNDLLSKLTLGIFGVSELSYRLPALAGCLLYLVSVFRISGRLFGARALSFLAAAVLSLNPLVLDYLCYGRGYSLALGLFLFAFDCLAQYAMAAEPGRGQIRLLLMAGAALGLSAGSNPIMIFPGGALAGVLFTLLSVESFMPVPQPAAQPEEKSKKAKKARRQRGAAASPRGIGQALLWFGLPAALTGGFLLSLPAKLVELEPGYMGPPSLAAILDPLVRFSLLHSPSGFPGLVRLLPAATWVSIGTFAIAPLCLAAVSVAAGAVLARWLRSRSFDSLAAIDRVLLLLGLTLPFTLVLIVASRYQFEQPYPEMRTAAYWLPLLSLAALLLVERFWQQGGAWKAASRAIAAALALCAVQFATQFNTRYFAEWAYCAAGRDMMNRVVADHSRGGASPVTAGVSWKLEPVINFYRAAWRLPWIEPVTRDSPAGSYNYYLLLPEDAAVVEQLGLRKLAEDRLSGAVLAVAQR